MQSYLPETAVSLPIAFVDANGVQLSATSGTYRIIDGMGLELVASTDLGLTAGDTEHTLAVDAPTNTLPYIDQINLTGPRQLTGVRTVQLILTLDDSSIVQQEFSYALRDVFNGLVVGVNSFQTYPNAAFIADDLLDIPSYLTASRAQQIAALSEARDALVQLRYKLIRQVAQDYLTPDHDVTLSAFGSSRLQFYTATELAQLPGGMLAALCKAQVLHADYLLGADPIEKARRDGIMSTTVGESSTMFRPGVRALDYPVCKRALAALSIYVSNPWAATITRS